MVKQNELRAQKIREKEREVEMPILDALMETVPGASVEEFVRFIEKYLSFVELGTNKEYLEIGGDINFVDFSPWRAFSEGKQCSLRFLGKALKEYQLLINKQNATTSGES